MLLERVLILGVATRFGGLLSIRGTESDEDPTGAAGDSFDEDDDDLEDDETVEHEERASDDDRETGDPDPEQESTDATAKRRHRFSDQDAAEEAFRELQSHKDRVEAENAILRAAQQPSSRQADPPPAPVEMNEAMMAEIGEAVQAEYLKLPKEKQHLGSATAIMARHMHDMNVREARRVAEAAQAESEARQAATKAAKAELQAVGLDPEADWDLMILQRDTLNRTNPTLLKGMAPADQFKHLAKATRDFLRARGVHTKAEVKQAKDEHNREAGGTMSGSSRRPASQTARGNDQDDDQDKDSMTSDLQANRSSLRRRSSIQYDLLNRSRVASSRR